MAGGLLQLVSYGIEDEILIANPQITFFKTVFRKYTNFSIDTLNTIHSVKFGTNNEISIPKSGELLYKLFIKLDLPKISAYYKTTVNDDIKLLVSNDIYNYNYDIYNTNISIDNTITDSINNDKYIQDNDYITSEYFLYITNNSTKCKNLFNTYESSNLMYTELNDYNLLALADSTYYTSRNILSLFNDNLSDDQFNYMSYDFYNENNYYTNEPIYKSSYVKSLKAKCETLFSNKNSKNVIIKNLFNCSLDILLDSINYNVETAYTYYNDFKDLYTIEFMPNEYLKQDYMTNLHGIYRINDITPVISITGIVETYDDSLIYQPAYLVFVDKTDKNLLVPVYITNIISDILTSTKIRYNYTGYINNINYFDYLIKNYKTNNYNYIHFDNFVIRDNYKFNKVNIILPILDIISTKDNKSYNYIIKFDVTGYDTTKLLDGLSKLKYVVMTNNDNGYLTNRNKDDSALKYLPPYVILLLDPDLTKKPNITNNELTIYCKHIKKSYDINNLDLLSPYVPISVNSNTDSSTKLYTDYELLTNYLVKNNSDNNLKYALNTINSYPKYVFNVVNQINNTTPLTLVNTIDKSDFTVNLNISFNQEQFNTYKTNLSLDKPIDNNFLDKINKNFTTYEKGLSTSYQFISLDTNNKKIFTELLQLYTVIKQQKNNVKPNLVNSFDITSLVYLVFKNINDIKDNYQYDDIYLTKLSNFSEKYKIRLNPSSKSIFSVDETNYINITSSDYDIYVDKIVKYNNDTYIIKYTYKFVQIIEIIDDHIDLYVKIDYKLYKNGSEIDKNIPLLFITQLLSYIPNKNDPIYNSIAKNNINIKYDIKYDDNQNFKCYLINYYISEPPTSNLDVIWEIQNNDSTIYDIISGPNCYYNLLFSENISIDTTISNLYLFDIYILILYNAYKNIILNNNNTMSNTISLIIQDYSYSISSFFKDPYVVFENNTLFNIKKNSSNNPISLETWATNNINISSTSYNLLNIIPNNTLLYSNNIYNTATDLLNRLTNDCLSTIEKIIIYNQAKLITFVGPLLNVPNKYIDINGFINRLKNNFSSTNVAKNLKELNSNIGIIRLETANNVKNNIDIFDNSSRQQLLSSVNIIISNLVNCNFSFQTNIINNINNINKYSDLFNIINAASKKYFEEYLNLSGVLNNMILPEIPSSSISNIINLFTSQITNYLDKNVIDNALTNLKNANIINKIVYDNIINNTIKITNQQNVYNVANTDALSFYHAISLLNLSLSNIKPLCSNVYNSLNTYISVPSDISDANTIIKLLYIELSDLTDSTLSNTISSNTMTLINLQTIINNLTIYTTIQPINQTIYNNITNKINIFVFESMVGNALKDNNIKIVSSNDNNEITNINVYIGSSCLSVGTSLNNNNLPNTNNNYDFINQLLCSNLFKTNSTLIYRIIATYNDTLKCTTTINLFTEMKMKAFVNLCNNYAENAINTELGKIEKQISIDIIAPTDTDFTNKLNYDYYIPYENLNFSDKIFYLYNYLIGLFYINNITFISSYQPPDNNTAPNPNYNDPSIYNIFIDDNIYVDNELYDPANPDYNYNHIINSLNKSRTIYMGPFLITHFDYSLLEQNQYLNVDFYSSPTYVNITRIFDYFMYIVGDTLPKPVPEPTTGLGFLYYKYVDKNKNYINISYYLSYIEKYSKTLQTNPVDPIILNKINNNPITKLIYDNIDLYIHLLIYISTYYNLSDLVTDKLSTIINTTVILKNTDTVDSKYETIRLANIKTYPDDTFYSDVISDNDLCNKYVVGILEYNINNSIYSNFLQMIDEQKYAYTKLYDTLTDMSDIGINSQSYIDLSLCNWKDKKVDFTYYNKRNLDVVNVNNNLFKSNYTISTFVNNNKTFNMFNDIIAYINRNISNYNSNLENIKFIEYIFDFTTNYSNIDGFYNVITDENNYTQNDVAENILTELKPTYQNKDATVLNSMLTNILIKTDILKNSVLDTIYKKSFITNNVLQTVDLHNFNKYYNSYVVNNNNDTNLQLLIKDMKNLKYFSFYNKINTLIINNYIGSFYTSSLLNITTKNKMIITMQNTKVSDKIDDCINSFNLLSNTEKENIIRLYYNLPKINGYLLYLYQTNYKNNNTNIIDTLINYKITDTLFGQTIETKYMFYDIIMTEEEYDLIFGNKLLYDFSNSSLSIKILIYYKSSGQKYDINSIYNNSKLYTSESAEYEFTLYRKTDLPSEYKYEFTDTNISKINLFNPIDDVFELLYTGISIHDNNMDVLRNICNTYMKKDNIIDDTNLKQNSDEQKVTYNISDIIINNTNTIITINDVLLSENHKLIRTNNNNLYSIKTVKSYAKKIYVNYPYNLIFTDTLENIKNTLDDRVKNNIILNEQIGSITLYIDSNPYTYDKKYFNFNGETSDFLFVNMLISGNNDNSEYNINDIIIKPYISLNDPKVSIPSMYNINNIIEITLTNNDDILINKNYMMTGAVKIYIENDNKHNLSEFYYIQDNQNTINATIVAVDNTKSIITLNDALDISNISSIMLGMQNILSIDGTVDPSDIKIVNTNYSLYDILIRFNTNILISELTNIPIYSMTYDSKYYNDLKQYMSNSDYIYSIITSNTNDIYNDNVNNSSNKFQTNIINKNNYKYNIFDVINNDFVSTETATNNSLYSQRNIYNADIIELIGKPDIAKFSYIPYLTDFIFDNIELKIDGYVVDQLKNGYMYIYHNLMNDKKQRISYNNMSMNNETLLLDSETKNAFSLYVEIPLYFCQIPGLALPLISAFLSNIDLNISIRKLDDLIIKNKYTDIKYINDINMTMVYSIIYLDDYERELFSTKRHEYLFEKKIYNINNKTDVTKLVQDKSSISFSAPIKDLYYYNQLDSMYKAKQYYNFTYNYLLPDLYMTTRNKLIYLQQMITYKTSDNKIISLYMSCYKLMMIKYNKFKFKTIINGNVPQYRLSTYFVQPYFQNLLKDLTFLYNNLSNDETEMIETYFNKYYEDALLEKPIVSSQLYMNGVERYKLINDITNMVIPIEYYNNIISGLYIYNFSLHPLEYQPSGSANLSVLKPEFRLTLSENVYNIGINDTLTSYLFGKTYNIMRFVSGVAGMAW